MYRNMKGLQCGIQQQDDTVTFKELASDRTVQFLIKRNVWTGNEAYQLMWTAAGIVRGYHPI